MHPVTNGLLREEGILSFWKGNGTNIIRIFPYSAAQLMANDQYKRILVNNTGELTVGHNVMQDDMNRSYGAGPETVDLWSLGRYDSDSIDASFGHCPSKTGPSNTSLLRLARDATTSVDIRVDDG